MTVPLDHVLGRIPGAVFEAQYREHADPWDFARSPYEQRRYRLTAAMLPCHRYRRAFEPGCSVGELTAHLAPRCDAVLAMETIGRDSVSTTTPTLKTDANGAARRSNHE
jgi:hypothetical protein